MLHKALTLLCALLAASVAQEVDNGDMSDAFVTEAGDTVPMGWGFNEADGTNRCGNPELIGCAPGVARLGYDLAIFHTPPGALIATGLYPDDTIGGSFDNGVTLGPGLYGETLTVRGWVRCADVNRRAEVAVKRGCSGGGYAMLEWVTVWSGTGTQDWTEFSGTVQVPLPAECSGLLDNPSLTVDVKVTGGGSIWVDDLGVQLAGSSETVSPPARRSSTGMLRQSERFSLVGRRLPGTQPAGNGVVLRREAAATAVMREISIAEL
jgi:hypothetical protein